MAFEVFAKLLQGGEVSAVELDELCAALFTDPQESGVQPVQQLGVLGYADDARRYVEELS